MSEWIEVDSAFINDGHYLCYCNDTVSSWHDVLLRWSGIWYDHSGNEYEPIVSHFMTLTEPPKN